MPDSFPLLLSICLFCVAFGFHCTKNPVISYLRPKENMGGEKKTNEYANQVDEEYNQRASIFLPINPLKINTSRFDSLATGRQGDIGLYPVWLLVCLVFSSC